MFIIYNKNDNKKNSFAQNVDMCSILVYIKSILQVYIIKADHKIILSENWQLEISINKYKYSLFGSELV